MNSSKFRAGNETHRWILSISIVRRMIKLEKLREYPRIRRAFFPTTVWKLNYDSRDVSYSLYTMAISNILYSLKSIYRVKEKGLFWRTSNYPKLFNKLVYSRLFVGYNYVQNTKNPPNRLLNSLKIMMSLIRIYFCTSGFWFKSF